MPTTGILDFYRSMAPGGRNFKQTTLTGEPVQVSQSLNESNGFTPAVTTGENSTSIKRGRGKTRGKGLEKLKKIWGKRMTIEIPIGKGRPIDKVQSAKLSNELGIIARNFIPLPNKWKELDKEEKDAALDRCNERFEIKLDEHYVKDSCEDILKNRSRQWRHKLKKIFESASSEEEARKIGSEVPELTPENWNRLCDLWLTPEHKKWCEINKANRSKLKYNHVMGSKAFVAARAEIAEKQPDGVEPDRIEFFYKTHYSTDKGWSTPEAKAAYDNMNDLKALYFNSDESPMTIDEIANHVLGEKSGYVKGLGYGPKPETTRATKRRAAELEDALRKSKQEAAIVQNNLQERLHSAESIVTDQQTQIKALKSQFGDMLARQNAILEEMRQLKGSSSSSDN